MLYNPNFNCTEFDTIKIFFDHISIIFDHINRVADRLSHLCDFGVLSIEDKCLFLYVTKVNIYEETYDFCLLSDGRGKRVCTGCVDNPRG